MGGSAQGWAGEVPTQVVDRPRGGCVGGTLIAPGPAGGAWLAWNLEPMPGQPPLPEGRPSRLARPGCQGPKESPGRGGGGASWPVIGRLQAVRHRSQALDANTQKPSNCLARLAAGQPGTSKHEIMLVSTSCDVNSIRVGNHLTHHHPSAQRRAVTKFRRTTVRPCPEESYLYSHTSRQCMAMPRH